MLKGIKITKLPKLSPLLFLVIPFLFNTTLHMLTHEILKLQLASDKFILFLQQNISK